MGNKDFENTIDCLKRYVNNIKVKRLLKSRFNKLKESINYMENDIKLALDDKEVEIKDKNVKMVIEVLKYYSVIYIKKDMDSDVNKFMKDYVNLVDNWSKLINEDSLNKILRELKNKIQYKNYILGALNILDDLNGEIKRYKDFSPSSFDLSMHYVSSINKNEE